MISVYRIRKYGKQNFDNEGSSDFNQGIKIPWGKNIIYRIQRSLILTKLSTVAISGGEW